MEIGPGYLLDTHTLLWFWEDDKKLSRAARDILTSYIKAYVSMVSLWEIAIKAKLGRLQPLQESFVDLLKKQEFSLLPIEFAHVMKLQSLPLHHCDPFDRMLIAQAKCEKLAIMTTDVQFKPYDVKLLKA